MALKVFGKIYAINSIQKISETFSKQEFVVKTDEQYPQLLSLELQQDSIALLERFKIGEDVAVSINIRGRVWTNPQGEDKYFNSLVAWNIEKMQHETPGQPSPQPESYSPAPYTPSPNEESDDLPF